MSLFDDIYDAPSARQVGTPTLPGAVDGPVDGPVAVDGPDDPAPPGVPSLEVFSLINDDLLPERSPKTAGLPAGISGLAGGGSARLAKVALLVVVAVVSGFLGYRAFAPGGGEQSAASEAGGTNDSGLPDIGDLGSALETAQLAAAEVELRSAAVEATVHAAEAGTYALAAEEWDALIGGRVVAATGTPEEGVLHVVSDAGAACFETVTPGGATVAAGVTDESLTFASDPSGAGLCTTDPATLAGWAPSLIALPTG